MTTYFCNDGNAELEIKANSAQEAAKKYVEGGDWDDAGIASVSVGVYRRIQCPACDGYPYSVQFNDLPIEDETYETAELAQDAIDTLYGLANFGLDTAEEERESKDQWTYNICDSCNGEAEVDSDVEWITVDIEPDTDFAVHKACRRYPEKREFDGAFRP